MDLPEKKKELLLYNFLPSLSGKAQTPLPLNCTSEHTPQQRWDVLSHETGVAEHKEYLSGKLA